MGEAMTRSLRKLCLAIVLCPLAGVAGATPLTIVNVSAPDINCVFETDCSVVVNDSIGNIALPTATGTARLQTLFPEKPGAPGDGKTAYEYRMDLTQATAIGDVSCVTALEVDFGPGGRSFSTTRSDPRTMFSWSPKAVSARSGWPPPTRTGKA